MKPVASYFNKGAEMKKTLVSILLCSALGVTAHVNAQTSDVVQIDSGKIQGSTDQNVTSFKGIPFAAPPVGNLRWKAPQPVTPWSDIKQTTQYGHDCMQLPFPSDAAPLGTVPAEDCLVMNVWKPANAEGKNLPVMVWIYGGGFVNGGSSPAVYDGSEFAKQDVIFVSFNYRVGRFGFFAHPALTKEDPDGLKGNYGFMDQIAALKWVQTNIQAFGGDPYQVTLVGESAGGFSIHTLMNSPLAKGLFQRAIIQSGGGRTDIGGGRRISTVNAVGSESAESIGLKFAAKFNIHGSDEKALAALRALPAEDIVSGLNMATMGDPTYAGPMIDGKVVTAQPKDFYDAGTGINIPLMVGTTDYEIGFPPKVSSMAEALKQFGHDNLESAAQIFKQTGVTDPQEVAQAISSDLLMVEPSRYVERHATAQGQPVYAYRFAYVADSVKKEWPGAFHATDIPFAFNTVKARFAEALTKNDEAAAIQTNSYWVNFAKNGNPNGDGLPTWSRYNTKQDNIMLLSNEGAEKSGMIQDPWVARLDLIAQLQPK